MIKSNLLLDKAQVKGFLNIREGIASNLEYDSEGNLHKWDFEETKDFGWNQNKICWGGYAFVLSRGWGVSAVIAAGNGDTAGNNAPANNNTQLVSEISSGRFTVPNSADGASRVNENVVTLQTLWPRGQGYIGQITEWGIFVTAKGGNLQTPNSGYLVSRIAQNYTRTAGNDLYLTWVITTIS